MVKNYYKNHKKISTTTTTSNSTLISTTRTKCFALLPIYRLFYYEIVKLPPSPKIATCAVNTTSGIARFAVTLEWTRYVHTDCVWRTVMASIFAFFNIWKKVRHFVYRLNQIDLVWKYLKSLTGILHPPPHHSPAGLPSWHLSPWYPCGQRHRYPWSPNPSWHVALKAHGLLWQAVWNKFHFMLISGEGVHLSLIKVNDSVFVTHWPYLPTKLPWGDSKCF